MALYYELPLYRDMYTLVLLLYKFTKEFPKEYKYSLAENIRRDALQLVRSIYRINKAQSKLAEINDFMDGFELLKLEVRLCVDMKLLPVRKQAQISELLERVGKQVTGWRKSSQ